MKPSSESLYAEHLAGHDEADSADNRAAEEVAFEALLGEHPERSEELKRLRDANRRLGAAMPRTLSEGSPPLHRPADAAKSAPKSAFHAEEGATIGEFQLVRLLGRGGMGEVWEAEQGSLSRRVALKLMLPERVDERGLDFFAREARAGGRLAHPGIVSVFGAGVNDGAHWIAMELVEGACDLRRSMESLREEAELVEGYYTHLAEFFAELADALETAHSAGVVHRDLKPGNILVTDDDSPKVSDFGLAKLTDEYSISHAGELLGTYYYMSPEQVATKRAGIDHRTDVFSLGVVMYEMLTLVRPFEGDTTEQVAHKILWVDATDPRTIRSRIPAELAVICSKSMEKDPDRRYQTMREFASDLRRHLANEPILATPPTMSQRLMKWTKRNPVKSLGGAAAAVAFAVVSVLLADNIEKRTELAAQTREAQQSASLAKERAEQLRLANKDLVTERQVSETAREEATRERNSAEERSAELVQVADFQAQQLSGIDPRAMGQKIRSLVMERSRAAGEREGRGEEALESEQAVLADLLSGADFTGIATIVLDEEVFERALQELEGFDNQPAIQAHLLQTVATALKDLGLLERSLQAQVRAVELYRLARGDEHSHTLISINNLGDVLLRQGKHTEAEPFLVEALEARRRTQGELHPRTLTSVRNLAGLFFMQGKLEQAEALFKEALEGHRQVFGEEHPDTLMSKYDLGRALNKKGRVAEAEAIFREVSEVQQRVIGDEHPDTLFTIQGLAAALSSLGRLEEAEACYSEVVGARRRTYGDKHPSTLASIGNYGLLSLSAAKYEQAKALLNEALEGQRLVLGDDHPNTLTAINNLGLVFQSQGDLEKAEALFRESLEGCRRTLGDDHFDTLTSIGNIGTILCNQQRFDEAEPFIREALESKRRVFGDESPEALVYLDTFALLLGSQGRYEEAERELGEGLAVSRLKFGTGNPITLKLMNRMGLVLSKMDKHDEALPFYEGALEGYRRALGDEHPKTLTMTHNLGMLFNNQGKLEEAERLFRNSLAGRRKVKGGDHADTRFSIFILGNVLYNAGKSDEAESLFREALEKQRRDLGDRHRRTLVTIGYLSFLLKGQGRFAEAEPLAREYLEGISNENPDYPNRVQLLEDIVAGLREGGADDKDESEE